MKKIIFVGDHFYSRSNTIMSCLYTEEGTRYDWGLAECDLEAGETLLIRPATDAELGRAYRTLDSILQEISHDPK